MQIPHFGIVEQVFNLRKSDAQCLISLLRWMSITEVYSSNERKAYGFGKNKGGSVYR